MHRVLSTGGGGGNSARADQARVFLFMDSTNFMAVDNAALAILVIPKARANWLDRAIPAISWMVSRRWVWLVGGIYGYGYNV